MWGVNGIRPVSGMIFLYFLAGCLLVAREVSAPDVTGKWDLTVETPQGKASPSVAFKQEGEKLTGIYRGRLGEVPLAGTVKGNEIEFSVTLKFRDQDFTVSYSGRVDGDTMKGTVQFGGSATGDWSARRQP